MRCIQWLTAISLLSALSSPAWSQTCLDNADKPGTSSIDIPLRPSRAILSFYSRADDYVAFFPEQDIKEYFERARRSSDQGLRRLAQLVLSDLPIKANQDLFAYVTRDWSVWGAVNFAIIQLIANGKATLTNLSGAPQEQLTVTRTQSRQVRGTTVMIGTKQNPRILWKYECSMD
jgi:hypothetical protein